jgi:hypothetical protein
MGSHCGSAALSVIASKRACIAIPGCSSVSPSIRPARRTPGASSTSTSTIV